MVHNANPQSNYHNGKMSFDQVAPHHRIEMLNRLSAEAQQLQGEELASLLAMQRYLQNVHNVCVAAGI